MKGWVGLVSWPVADGLPTLVVTHQLQVERRTAKVRRPETDVLPLCHATVPRHCATPPPPMTPLEKVLWAPLNAVHSSRSLFPEIHRRDPDTYQKHGPSEPLVPPESTVQTSSRSVQLLLYSSAMSPTDRHMHTRGVVLKKNWGTPERRLRQRF